MIVARVGREDIVLAAARVIEAALLRNGRKNPVMPVLEDRTTDEAGWI